MNHYPMRWLHRFAAVIVAAGLACPAAGDAQPIRIDAQAPVPVAAEDTGTPADAAWSTLQAIRDYVKAVRSSSGPEGVQAVRRAKDALLRLAGVQAGTQADTTRVLRWPSTIGYYVDGLQRDRLHVRMLGERKAEVSLVAANPADQAEAERLLAQKTAELQGQGLSGEDLARRRAIVVQRELLQRGIGYPVETTIVLDLAKAGSAWKVTRVQLRPPEAGRRARATQPAGTRPGVRRSSASQADQ